MQNSHIGPSYLYSTIVLIISRIRSSFPPTVKTGLFFFFVFCCIFSITPFLPHTSNCSINLLSWHVAIFLSWTQPPPYFRHITVSQSVHTSGSLLCWWEPSPTRDVWACSSPPVLRLRCSLAPSPNGALSPRLRGRAARGPQSPFSPSRGMTGSTASLRGEKSKNSIFNIVAHAILNNVSSCVSGLPPTCDGVCQVLVLGLPQQPDQSRHSVTVLDGNLVVWVFAVRDVLQCSAGCIMNLQQRHSNSFFSLMRITISIFVDGKSPTYCIVFWPYTICVLDQDF